MSIQTIINYDNPDDFVFSDSITVDATSAKLALIGVEDEYNQPFDSDEGFDYTASKSEFTGGLVQQKSQRPINSTFGAKYSVDQTASWGSGSLTGSLVGGATVAAGKLNISGANSACIYSSPDNVNWLQTGSVKFKFTSNYSGFPVAQQFLLNAGGSVSPFRNQVSIFHSSAGSIYVYIKNKDGGNIVVLNCGDWSPVSATTYEFCLCFDVTTGATRLFIDGIQKGGTDTSTGIRDATDCNLVIVGNSATVVYGNNGSFDDLVFYSTVQHTTNYTPGYTLPDADYLESTVTLPEMEYEGPGTLLELTNFETVEANGPRYTIQIGRSGNYLYHNGASWVTSDGSFTQANTLATFLANIATLPIDGEIYVQFKVHFQNTNSQQSISDLTATIDGEMYSTANPTVELGAIIDMDGISSFNEDVTTPVGTVVKYNLIKNSQKIYYDGATWSNADGTYAQTNTAAEILANVSSLDLTDGYHIGLIAFLHSDDGLATPELISNTILYDFYVSPEEDINECIIYCFIEDIIQGDLSEMEDMKLIVGHDSFVHTGRLFPENTFEVDFNSEGYAEISIIETESIAQNISFAVTGTINGVETVVEMTPAQIPDSISKNLVEISSVV